MTAVAPRPGPPAPVPAGELAGLSSAEVEERIAAGRTNAFAPTTGRTYRAIWRDNLVTPFNVTLVSLLSALLLMGRIGDTLFSAGAVVTNTVVGLVQEIRAKRTMDRLARAAAGTVRVRRDGAMRDIPPTEIVADDLVEVTSGDRITVDGPVVWSDALEVDESLITGETDLVPRAAGDDLTSGSFVAAGRGLQRAERLGADSYVNRLGQTAAGYKHSLTPVQRAIDAIVEISVLLMAIFGPLVFVQGYVQGIPLADMLTDAVVVATVFVPQGLVLATTVALSVGAIQIGRRRTLVQRINAVESMGNVTVLCFDKTGTLTRNALELVEVEPLDGRPDGDVRADLAVYVGVLSAENRTVTAVGDAVGRDRNGATKVAETAFTSARKWGSVSLADGRTFVLGAPEVVVADPEVLARARASAEGGLRVLVFAVSPASPAAGSTSGAAAGLGAGAAPGSPAGPAPGAAPAQLPSDLRPVALLHLRDVVRPEVGATLADLANRGISLRVISGDSLETVRAIVDEVGLPVRGAITGPELDALDDHAFAEVVAATDVFARISPQAKRRIVRALADRGEYVAMVGDGVNDVPALKEARLGVAMANGVQMAKDVSDLVLLDSSLATLPAALDEGLATTQKVYASTRLILSKNTYMILAVIFIGFMALPFPGQVRQLSWMTTLTTGVPAFLVSIGWLRPRTVRDFRRRVIGWVLVTGLVGSLALATAYAATYFATGEDALAARTALSITALAYGVIVLWDVLAVSPFSPWSVRRHPREALTGVGVAVVGLVVPLVLPGLFNVGQLPADVLVGLAVGIVILAAVHRGASLVRLRILRPIRILVHSGRGG